MAQTFSFPNYGLFNATYYLQQNPDVATSWTGTPLQHYIQFGALEGRAPTAWFNADFYRQAYTDLQSMNALQLFNHYCNNGFNEGRVPMLNFSNFNGARYLLDNPDVAAAGYTAGNAISHFVNYGEYEGRVAYANNGVVIEPVVNLGEIFTLTTGVDNFFGTSHNDTFNAPVVANGYYGANTLNALDILDGAGGIDTLNADLARSVTPALMQNIEVINATGTNYDTYIDLNPDIVGAEHRAVILDLINAPQVTNVNNVGSYMPYNPLAIDLSEAALVFNNIADGADLSASDTNVDSVFNYRNTTGIQAADLAVTNNTGDVVIDGVETVNIASTKNASDFSLYGSADLVKVTVAGDADLDLNDVEDSVLELNATGFLGDLTADITGQVSNTTATLVKGGLGDDVFSTTAAAGVGTTASVLDGGAGRNTLNFAVDNVLLPVDLVDAGSITIANIQTVNITEADNVAAGQFQVLDASLVGGLETVNLTSQQSNGFTNVLTVTGLQGEQHVNVASVASTEVLPLVSGGVVVNVGVKDGTGAADVAHVGLTTAKGTDTEITFNQVGPLPLIEKLHMHVNNQSYGDIEVEGSFNTLEIVGGKAGETLVVGPDVALTNKVINAAALDSDLLVNLGNANQNVTGGSGDDMFVFETFLGTNDSVDGGAGDNTVAYKTTVGTTGPHLTNVQNLEAALVAATSTLSLVNSSGVENIVVDATAGTESVSFTNLDSSLATVEVVDRMGDLTVSMKAGQVADTTLTIDTDQTVGLVPTGVRNVVFNNGGELTVNVQGNALAAAAVNNTITTLKTNATSLTLNTGLNEGLATAVGAAAATSIAINAAAGGDANVLLAGNLADATVALAATDIAVSAVDSDGATTVTASNAAAIQNLDVSADLGGNVEAIATAATKTDVSYNAESLTVSTGADSTTIAQLILTTVATGATQDLDATIGQVTIENGVDAVTSNTIVALVASNDGVASIGTLDITALDGVATATIQLQAQDNAASDASSIDALNVDVAAGATVNVSLSTNPFGGADLTTDINSGEFGGAGSLNITTGFLTALDLSNVGTDLFEGDLTITGDASMIDITGTNYGETINFNAAAVASIATGLGGADDITLATGAFADVLNYESQSDSTGLVYDYVTGFSAPGAGVDKIDLSALMMGNAEYSGPATAGTVVVNATTGVFTVTNAAGFFSGVAAPDAGRTTGAVSAQSAFGEYTVVFVDANQTGSWEAAQDMAVVLVGNVGLTDAANFVWA